MRRKLTFISLSLAATFSVFLALAILPASAASTVYVAADGSDVVCDGTEPDAPVGTEAGEACAFASIQAAVAAVDANGTVVIGPGTFTGDLVIDKSITLSGAGDDSSFIQGVASSSEFTTGNVLIQADGVTIEDVALLGSSASTPNFATSVFVNSTNATIQRVTFAFSDNTTTSVGVGMLGDVAGLLIDDATFALDSVDSGGYIGVDLSGLAGPSSGAVTVSDSTFSGAMAQGIRVSTRDDVTVSGNTFAGEGTGQTAILLQSPGPAVAITGNTVSNLFEGIAADGSQLAGSVTGNTFSGNTTAFRYNDDPDHEAAGFTLSGNSFTGNTTAVATTFVALNATANYWGSPTGPTVEANPGGAGDPLSGTSTFSPWCADADCDPLYGIPTQLAIATQPAGGEPGGQLATQPVVNATDGEGNLGYNFAGAVSVVIDPAATLTGTTSVTAANGVATFTDLGVTEAGAYALLFQDSGTEFAQVTSDAIVIAWAEPALTSLDPTSITAGASEFALTVYGTDFIDGSTVFWEETALATTFVGETELSATVPASLVAEAGVFDVTVHTADTVGDGVTDAASFTVNNPAPSLDSISPVSANQWSDGFTLTLNGSSFVDGASVAKWGGESLTTTFVSANQLTATVPAGLLEAAGDVSITVTTAAPGGGASAAETFSVELFHPEPGITSLSPATKQLNDANLAVSVNGSGFVDGESIVELEGEARETAFVSTTQLTVTLLAGDVDESGEFAVTVVNGTPGGGTSNAATLSVENPAPAITLLTPAEEVAGGDSFTLAVTGMNFIEGDSVVEWAGEPRATTFVSSTELTIEVTAEDIADGGLVGVSVVTSGPGGGESSTLFFTVNNPEPLIASIDPAEMVAGSEAFVLTITGSGFVPGSVVRFDLMNQEVTFVSSTELTVEVSADEVASAGAIDIEVENPTPGGGTSDTAQLIVTEPIPDEVCDGVDNDLDTDVDEGFADTDGDGTADCVDSDFNDDGIDDPDDLATGTLEDSESVSVEGTDETAGVGATFHGVEDLFVAVGTYDGQPVGPGIVVAPGGFIEVFAEGAEEADSLEVVFTWPASLTPAAEESLALRYWDGNSWEPVLSSGGTAPVKDLDANTFTVVFDATSTPMLSALTGTVFALAAAESYDLSPLWTLVPWLGIDGMPLEDALTGFEQVDNPITNRVLESVTAIYHWNAAEGTWGSYFPNVPDIPAALQTLTTFGNGEAYWIATPDATVTWTIQPPLE